jgi:hypothetical protein
MYYKPVGSECIWVGNILHQSAQDGHSYSTFGCIGVGVILPLVLCFLKSRVVLVLYSGESVL